MSVLFVFVAQAFIRAEPVARRGNELAILPENTSVREIGPKQGKWHHVECKLAGATFQGFVSDKVLKPQNEFKITALAGPKIPAVHYKEGNSFTLRTTKANASPLGESSVPRRLASDGLSVKPLREFVDWAKVDSQANKRWWPAGGLTYCNIYAYDYCYAAGVYLPRVWWKPEALKQLRAGKEVAVAYDQSVRELNANSLHDWLLDFGADYGWKRATSINELQKAANSGAVAVICAARTDARRSGHITAVVAEGNGQSAVRHNGQVTLPLQSQAGVVNVRYGTLGKPWWSGSQFRSFVFFYNTALSRW